MKTLFSFVGLAVVLFLTGLFFYGGYLFIDYLWSLYAELEAVIRIVLLSSMSVVVISSLIIANSIRYSAQSENKKVLMDARLNLYKSLVELYSQIITGIQQSDLTKQKDIVSKLHDLNAEMSILASGSVLDLHGKMEMSLNDSEHVEKLDMLFQQLIKAIRRDLGHGKNYDESKLKFLIVPARSDASGQSGLGVSL